MTQLQPQSTAASPDGAQLTVQPQVFTLAAMLLRPQQCSAPTAVSPLPVSVQLTFGPSSHSSAVPLQLHPFCFQGFAAMPGPASCLTIIILRSLPSLPFSASASHSGSCQEVGSNPHDSYSLQAGAAVGHRGRGASGWASEQGDSSWAQEHGVQQLGTGAGGQQYCRSIWVQPCRGHHLDLLFSGTPPRLGTRLAISRSDQPCKCGQRDSACTAWYMCRSRSMGFLNPYARRVTNLHTLPSIACKQSGRCKSQLPVGAWVHKRHSRCEMGAQLRHQV